MLGDAAPLPQALTDRQLLLVVITKQPSLLERVQCSEEEHTPDSVMAQTWTVLHDALPPSESGLRDQLMLRVRPTASIKAEIMRPEHTNATDENRASCKQPQQRDSAELESIFDAPWPCSSPQYDRKLSNLRAATSLAAQRPEAALKDLADDRMLSEVRAALNEASSRAEALSEVRAALNDTPSSAKALSEVRAAVNEASFRAEASKCVTTEPEAALASEEHFKIEERQVLLATPEARRRSPQGSKLGTWWRRSR